MAETAIMSAEKVALQYAQSTSTWVISDIKLGKLPQQIAGYNVSAEAESAMRKILNVTDKNNKYALDVCTRESICSSVRDMVIQGLSVTKNQGYFIVRGSQLQLMRSYFGTQTIFNRNFPYLRAVANVLFEGDEFDYAYDEVYGFEYVDNIKPKAENRDKPIKIAFGVIIDIRTKERVYGCVMTAKEIKTAWSHGQTHKVQDEFPQEMAKRTLLNRMLKNYINTSDSIDPRVAESFNRTTENEYATDEPSEPKEVDKMIRQKSRGAEGLSEILKQAETPKEEPKKMPEFAPNPDVKAEAQSSVNAKAPKNDVDEFVDENGEIIQGEKSNASTGFFEEDEFHLGNEPDDAPISAEEEFDRIPW